MGIVAGDPIRVLVQPGLPQQDGSGRGELFDYGRVVAGYEVVENSGAGGGLDPLGKKQIFEGVGDTVERSAAVAGVNLSFGGFSLTQRQVGSRGDVRVQLRVEPLDAVESLSSQFDGRDFSGGNQAREFCNALEGGFHWRLPAVGTELKIRFDKRQVPPQGRPRGPPEGVEDGCGKLETLLGNLHP